MIMCIDSGINETKSQNVSCAVAACAEIIGAKWTALLVHDLRTPVTPPTHPDDLFAQQAQTPAESAQAEGLLSQALGRLFAVAEAYPELQADENFRQLQTELAETENRIAVSRQVYNDTVLTFNNAIQTVPGVFFAGPFGFTQREFFDVEDDAQREPPQVSFTPGAPAS